MQHQFEYEEPGQAGVKRLHSSLVLEGQNEQHTAMALTVGLPLAITVKNFITGEFDLRGLQIPIRPEIYKPLLKELEEHQIHFVEEELNESSSRSYH
jgi:saccharopine dehydrogenase (NADP+, L-glutamate forming)